MVQLWPISLARTMNAGEVMDNKPGSNFAFARDLYPCDRHAKDINE